MSLDAPQESWRGCRILVVDDAHLSRRLIAGYLAAAGVQNIEFAADGLEALEKVESFRPDIVILDIMMPHMDGFEVCRRLRADPVHKRLPILVQTGLESMDQRIEVFKSGATDLVSKPINGPELVARTRVHLENRLLIDNLEAYQLRIHEELTLAREMQADILPSFDHVREIERLYGVEIASHVEPSSELGGDFWGVLDMGQGRLGIFIVDFAGHGVTAALNTFRMHTLMRQAGPDHSPADFLKSISDRLVELLAPYQYATMLFATLDTNANTLTYAGAGAPSPVMGHPAGIDLLDGRGLPIGVTKAARYEDKVVPFPPGSFLMLYSDALTETADGKGDFLEEEQVVALAERCRHEANPLPTLLRLFRADRARLTDDLTAVWLARP